MTSAISPAGAAHHSLPEALGGNITMNKQISGVHEIVAILVGKLEGAAYPFTLARRYIDELKADPNWNASELSELRLQVVRELLAR